MFTAVKYNLSDAPGEYWEFVHKHGNIYNSRPYLEGLLASGMRAFIVAVRDGEEIVGGITVTIGGSVLGRAVNASAYYAPVVKDHAQTADILASIPSAIKHDSLFLSVCLNPCDVAVINKHPVTSKWQKRKVTFLNWNISPDYEQLWKELPKGKKSSVNRAKREGIIIERITTDEQIEQFYGLHTMSMTRGERANQPSLDYFKSMFAALQRHDLMAGFLALHPQTRKPIAAVTLLLGMHKEATYWAVGQDYEYRTLGATDFLVWHCLEFLKQKGYTAFDLVGLPEGDSPRAEGIRHFKTAWAGSNGQKQESYVVTHSNIAFLSPTMTMTLLNSFRKALSFITSAVRRR